MNTLVPHQAVHPPHTPVAPATAPVLQPAALCVRKIQALLSGTTDQCVHGLDRSLLSGADTEANLHRLLGISEKPTRDAVKMLLCMAMLDESLEVQTAVRRFCGL